MLEMTSVSIIAASARTEKATGICHYFEFDSGTSIANLHRIASLCKT